MVSRGRNRTLTLRCMMTCAWGKYDDWNQYMWWVLIEKTSGEALLRVRTVESENGMEAYRRLHNWYGKQTEMGLAEFRQRAIRPAQANRE